MEEGLDPATRAQWEIPASWVGVDNVRRQSLLDTTQRTHRIAGIVEWARRGHARRAECQRHCSRRVQSIVLGGVWDV